MITRISLLLFVCSLIFTNCTSQNEIKKESKSNKMMSEPMPINFPKNREIATLGTGCFWCTEAIFQSLEGVEKAESGYAGGHVENPTYEAVCGKQTGHAEVVQITFDPKVISYAELLEIFWTSHDPTTLNRQGNDVGPQYRSAIFYHNATQKQIAEESLKLTDASDLWSDPIVTELTPFSNYYAAEDYHQEYFDRVGDRNPYCRVVVGPKVAKFKKMYKEKLKKEISN